MKRNTGNNEQGCNDPDGQRATDENLRDGSPVGPLVGGSKAGSFDDLESWSREDFEAALPLYVGGELDAQEAARVDAWLIAHPEDQGTFAASKQAAGVLARYAEFTKERETPDLWAGIRSGLIEDGTLVEHSAAASGRSTNTHERPILGGPRWFQRKSVAAAAALLLTGSVGLFLMNRGAEMNSNVQAPPVMAASDVGTAVNSGAVDSLATSRVAVADASSEMASLPGEKLESGAAGTVDRPLMSSPVHHPRIESPARGQVRGKSQRLQLAQKGAERLIDDAPKALLWQSDPWVETSQGLVRRSDGPQLTGGR